VSSREDLWRSHPVPEIGLSVDFCQESAIESLPVEGGCNIYQRIAGGDGLLFLRYGSRETPENLIATTADYITTVSLVNENAVRFCEEEAKHVSLLATRQSLREYRYEGASLVDAEHPEDRAIISVIGFSHNGIPVLVGYRIPEAKLEAYRSYLDRFIQSASTL
jgi:hypothetical protein